MTPLITVCNGQSGLNKQSILPEIFCRISTETYTFWQIRKMINLIALDSQGSTIYSHTGSSNRGNILWTTPIYIRKHSTKHLSLHFKFLTAYSWIASGSRKDTSESISNTPYLKIWRNLILKQQINRWIKKSTTSKSPPRHISKILS